jgi:CheY-like chemotaxis protein
MAEAANGPTILVVDDEPAVRIVITRLLLEAGYRVLSAMSGPEALDRLQEAGPIQVLLTDLRMPTMNGVQLALRVLHLCPGTRVVIMAAYPSDDPLAWPVLIKPFPLSVLEAEIRRALDGPDARGGSGDHAARVE